MDWHRRSTRLRGWSYAQPGDYFVTVRARDADVALCEVAGTGVRPSPAGRIVEAVWRGVARRFRGTRLHTLQIMPDHLHAIVSIGIDCDQDRFEHSGTGPRERMGPPALGRVVRALKAASSRLIRKQVCDRFAWQRGYHDRLIRSVGELERIRRYIETNPLRWTQ